MAKLNRSMHRTKSQPKSDAESEALSFVLEYLELQVKLAEVALRRLDVRPPARQAARHGSPGNHPSKANGLQVAAQSLRLVNHVLSMLEALFRDTVSIGGRGDQQLKRILGDPSRVQSMRRRVGAAGDFYSRVRGEITVPEPTPDPYCMWWCELMNEWRCRRDPNCTLTPCELVC
jgi:hypothetical protein